MKTTNKIFLLLSLIFANGLTHGNNVLDIASTIGLFAGPLMMATQFFIPEKHIVKPFLAQGGIIFSASNVYKIACYWNKQLMIGEKMIDIQEKNYKINQEILKKLEKKEAKQTL